MSKDSQNSIDCKTFVGLIQSILDDEATQEQKTLFNDHKHMCSHCAEKFSIERTVIETIRNKIDKDFCPNGFADLVRDAVLTNESKEDQAEA